VCAEVPPPGLYGVPKRCLLLGLCLVGVESSMMPNLEDLSLRISTRRPCCSHRAACVQPALRYITLPHMRESRCTYLQVLDDLQSLQSVVQVKDDVVEQHVDETDVELLVVLRNGHPVGAVALQAPQVLQKLAHVAADLELVVELIVRTCVGVDTPFESKGSTRL
jgi:hypothetical protein